MDDIKRYTWLKSVLYSDVPVPILGTDKTRKLRDWALEQLNRILPAENKEILMDAIKSFYLLPVALEDYYGAEIRTHIHNAKRSGGVKCPTCDQLAKEYKVRFSTNCAVFMKSLVLAYLQDVNTGGDGWIHYKELKFSSRDYPYTAYWKLAMTRKDQEGRKRTSGEWRPTKEGIDFVFNKVKIPAYVYTYNGDVTGFDDKNMIKITDALKGENFDLAELMNLYPLAQSFRYVTDRK